MSLLSDGNLLPFRQYNETDVLNGLFALNATGLNGQLVALDVTGAQSPEQQVGGYSTSAPNGVAFTNVGNYRYGLTRKVRPAAAGDTRFNVVGVTLHTTALYDENGNLLVNQPYEHTIERGFVQTGCAVPILTRGLITVKLANIVGAPVPGYAATIGANGAFGCTNPSDVGAIGTGLFAVGKFLSISGSAFGGYAQIKLEL